MLFLCCVHVVSEFFFSSISNFQIYKLFIKLKHKNSLFVMRHPPHFSNSKFHYFCRPDFTVKFFQNKKYSTIQLLFRFRFSTFFSNFQISTVHFRLTTIVRFEQTNNKQTSKRQQKKDLSYKNKIKNKYYSSI